MKHFNAAIIATVFVLMISFGVQASTFTPLSEFQLHRQDVSPQQGFNRALAASVNTREPTIGSSDAAPNAADFAADLSILDQGIEDLMRTLRSDAPTQHHTGTENPVSDAAEALSALNVKTNDLVSVDGTRVEPGFSASAPSTSDDSSYMTVLDGNYNLAESVKVGGSVVTQWEDPHPLDGEQTSRRELQAGVSVDSQVGSLRLQTGLGVSAEPDKGGTVENKRIGAEYGLRVFGADVKAGVEFKNAGGAQGESVLTKQLEAVVPLAGDQVEVDAAYKVVDLDDLKNAKPGQSDRVAKIGVKGTYPVAPGATVQGQYEWTRTQDDTGRTRLSQEAGAQVDYQVDPKASVSAGYRIGHSDDGLQTRADVNIGYQLSPLAALKATYQLIDSTSSLGGLGGLGGQKSSQRTNRATAELSMKF